MPFFHIEIAVNSLKPFLANLTIGLFCIKEHQKSLLLYWYVDESLLKRDVCLKDITSSIFCSLRLKDSTWLHLRCKAGNHSAFVRWTTDAEDAFEVTIPQLLLFQSTGSCIRNKKDSSFWASPPRYTGIPLTSSMRQLALSGFCLLATNWPCLSNTLPTPASPCPCQ